MKYSSKYSTIWVSTNWLIDTKIRKLKAPEDLCCVSMTCKMFAATSNNDVIWVILCLISCNQISKSLEVKVGMLENKDKIGNQMDIGNHCTCIGFAEYPYFARNRLNFCQQMRILNNKGSLVWLKAETPLPTMPSSYWFKLLLVGDPAVGKSSILQR